jgi:hypothetical protein
MAVWFRHAASWVRSGEDRAEAFGSLPGPPRIPGADDALVARATWYALLHEDIREILDNVGPPRPVPAPRVGGMLHASG